MAEAFTGSAGPSSSAGTGAAWKPASGVAGKLRGMFAECGMPIAEGELQVLQVLPAKVNAAGRRLPAVIRFRVDVRLRDRFVSKAVSKAMRDKGVAYYTQLTAVELQHKRYVQQHIKFREDLARCGHRPIWRLDSCSLEGRWPDADPEKLYNVYTLAPHDGEVVDMSTDN